MHRREALRILAGAGFSAAIAPTGPMEDLFMEAETYSFNVGAFGCVALADGLFYYPARSLFSNVPREELEAVLRGRSLSAAQVATPYTCLFIDTGQHRVLIDTGAGSLYRHADAIFPGVDHTTTLTGRLLPNLRALGIAPEEIDTVIISHAHPDHVGGTLDDNGEPVFAGAHYFIWKAEWVFWFSERAAEEALAGMVEIARKNLAPLREWCLPIIFLLSRAWAAS